LEKKQKGVARAMPEPGNENNDRFSPCLKIYTSKGYGCLLFAGLRQLAMSSFDSVMLFVNTGTPNYSPSPASGAGKHPGFQEKLLMLTKSNAGEM
jgi:hypothetical protein